MTTEADIREAVRRFADAGPLPSEDHGNAGTIDAAASLLEAIPDPVTDGEAQELARCFGPDTCYGLSWSLLHLIETAPGAMTARYPDVQNVWVRLLVARVDNAAGE